MKLTASLLFVFIGITSYMDIGATGPYGLFIIIALVAGMIGDGFMVYDDVQKFFILGLTSFLIGHLIYTVVFAVVAGFIWFDLVVYVGVLVGSYIVYIKSTIDLGKMKIPSMIYFMVISLMFTMAISLLYKSQTNLLTAILIATGATLFIASDIMLGFRIFASGKIKMLKVYVLIAYYFAQVLFGLSIMTYIN